LWLTKIKYELCSESYFFRWGPVTSKNWLSQSINLESTINPTFNTLIFVDVTLGAPSVLITAYRAVIFFMNEKVCIEDAQNFWL